MNRLCVNLHRSLCLSLLVLLHPHVYGATIVLSPGPATGPRTATLTEISGLQWRQRGIRTPGGSSLTLLDVNRPRAVCYTSSWPAGGQPNCTPPPPIPQYPCWENGHAGMMAELQRYVGLPITVPGSYSESPVDEIQFECATSQDLVTTYYGKLNVVESPAACTVGTSEITFEGMLGERLTASARVPIKCDSPATVQVMLASGGVVSIGGGGKVVLTLNGADVTTVTGTEPTLIVEGELTKSPKGAGTYRGATVVRLDVL